MGNTKTDFSLFADILATKAMIDLRTPFLFTIKERGIVIDYVKAIYSISNNRVQFQFRRKKSLGVVEPYVHGNKIRFSIGRHLKQLYVDPKPLAGQYTVQVMDGDWGYVTQDSWYIIQL